MIRTAEYVSCGHPDKVADQISDAILDAYLKLDPNAHVAVETMVTDCNRVILAGEVKASQVIPYSELYSIAERVIKEIGYVKTFGDGFDANELILYDYVHSQSKDLQENQKNGIVAGDQGIMFGYACNETPTLMPLEHYLARYVINIMGLIRRVHPTYFGPDCKAQVSVNYRTGEKPYIETILISTQHSEDCNISECSKDIATTVWNSIKENCREFVSTRITPVIRINPAGRFVKGGPAADTGLTGRKIVVDSYGGVCPVGGGAFSGKDPSKVDRSAAYYARYIAKNVVATGITNECKVSLAYTIGSAGVTNFSVMTKNGMLIPQDIIIDTFEGLKSVEKIVEELDLKKPIYEQTAKYGHFGIPTYSWERLDKVEQLKQKFNVK